MQSFKRGDNFTTTIEDLKIKSTVLASHRSCVSSYTLQHHIEHYVKKLNYTKNREQRTSHTDQSIMNLTSDLTVCFAMSLARKLIQKNLSR